ncbi:MAG: hypothetical protein AAF720_01630 [Pseudomonadota bacterium]
MVRKRRAAVALVYQLGKYTIAMMLTASLYLADRLVQRAEVEVFVGLSDEGT